jgi:hypothetical protein
MSPSLSTEPTPEPAQACPSCASPVRTQTLLTSMRRYYACGDCSHRWNEPFNRAR